MKTELFPEVVLHLKNDPQVAAKRLLAIELPIHESNVLQAKLRIDDLQKRKLANPSLVEELKEEDRDLVDKSVESVISDLAVAVEREIGTIGDLATNFESGSPIPVHEIQAFKCKRLVWDEIQRVLRLNLQAVIFDNPARRHVFASYSRITPNG